ncbi:MAG: hypothetical protein GC191_04130 [Azospirillum sp.]|nr:hypothetical protein [Azospirillum sp.]
MLSILNLGVPDGPAWRRTALRWDGNRDRQLSGRVQGTMPMPKNIVVCCDGTSNEFKKNRTNVVKLFFTLVKDPIVQACYYQPGVGSMAPPGFATAVGARIAQVAGLAMGYGLRDDISDACIFICRNFEPGDRLYLFGFSRGAYTVRAIASLLHMYGLVPSENVRLVPHAVRMMWRIVNLQRSGDKRPLSDPDIQDYFQLARDFKATFSRPCAPHFVGVWDTVSSVGWFSNPVRLPYTANNPGIAIGRHAVSIDENRAFFRTNLWQPSADPARQGPKDLLEVWFPGDHGDVGGGHPEPESGLSKIALKWMLDEAAAAGLALDDAKVARMLGQTGDRYARPDPQAPAHDPMTPWWRLLEYVPKPHWEKGRWSWRPNRFRRRRWPVGPVVDDGVWLRDGGAYAARLPPDAVRLSQARNRRNAAPAPPAAPPADQTSDEGAASTHRADADRSTAPP